MSSRRACLAVLLATAPADAAEPSCKPTAENITCIDVAIHEATPASLEWSFWVAGGLLLGAGEQDLGASVGVGGELTFGLLEYPGFPSGPYGKEGRAELRAGPWVAGALHRDGGVVEGGLKLHLGAVYHASWGTYELRAGSGYGAFPDGKAPHLGGTLAWGVRSVVARYTKRGACDPLPEPLHVAEASVARLFLSYRRAFDDAGHQVILGLELSPTFLLPPYDGSRLSGGPAW